MIDQSDNTTTLADLLQEYNPDEVDVPEEWQKDLEKAVDQVRRTLARTKLFARVDELEEPYLFKLTVVAPMAARMTFPQGMRVWIRPIMLQDGNAVEIDRSAPLHDHEHLLARFSQVSFEALTSFFAVRVEHRVDGHSATSEFVLNLPLHGAPEDRHERLLRAVLRDRQQVMRYLQLLLAGSGLETATLMLESAAQAGSDIDGVRESPEKPLFESLMRALYQNPSNV